MVIVPLVVWSEENGLYYQSVHKQIEGFVYFLLNFIAQIEGNFLPKTVNYCRFLVTSDGFISVYGFLKTWCTFIELAHLKNPVSLVTMIKMYVCVLYK